MTYGTVFVLPRAAMRQAPRVQQILHAAWSAHGPSHREVAPPWTPSLEPNLARVRMVFEVSDPDAVTLASLALCIPPETADILLSRTPWAKAHARTFVADLQQACARLTPPLAIGVWRAPLRGTRRGPALSVVSDPVIVDEFLELEPNQLLLDVRAGP